jgi:hypothetical protein
MNEHRECHLYIRIYAAFRAVVVSSSGVGGACRSGSQRGPKRKGLLGCGAVNRAGATGSRERLDSRPTPHAYRSLTGPSPTTKSAFIRSATRRR